MIILIPKITEITIEIIIKTKINNNRTNRNNNQNHNNNSNNNQERTKRHQENIENFSLSALTASGINN